MISLRKKLGLLLWPASVLYGFITKTRNWLFNNGILKETSFNIPLISIGNITVGGTGKTPHVEYIINLLHKEYSIAVLSRGYKRKTSGFKIASPKSGIEEIGDEPKQIKQKFQDIKVAVSEKRVEGVAKLLNDYPELDAIVLDDAFQHRYIKPGLSILLIDYNRPLVSDYLLPRGDLRESRYETRRAQIIIVTKTPENINPLEKTIFKKGFKLYPYQQIYFTSLAYSELKPVFKKNTNKVDSGHIKSKQIHVMILTGIANPEPLKKYIQTLTNTLEVKYYPDHYQYTENDLAIVSGHFANINKKDKIIITTEKDATRLKEIKNVPKNILYSTYYLPVKVAFLENGDKFNNTIFDFVKKAKRKL